eukprot:267725_1
MKFSQSSVKHIIVLCLFSLFTIYLNFHLFIDIIQLYNVDYHDTINQPRIFQSNATLVVHSTQNQSNATLIVHSNAFCDHLLPKKQFYIGFQHKTGHIIGQHLFKYLSEYCGHGFVLYHAKSMDNHPYLIYNLLNIINDTDTHMIYHFTRDPLSTILSGYNYWRNGKESWVKNRNVTTLHHDTRFIHFDYELNKSYDLARASTQNVVTRTPYHCYLDEFIFDSNFPFPFDIKHLKFAFDIDDNEYGVQWMANNNYSIAKWYKYLENRTDFYNGSIGYFEEFKRYFNCEFNDKYAMYQLIKKYHGENNDYHMFWNADWRNDFDQTLDRFLDSIHFVESEENRKILDAIHANETNDFNITNERKKFVKLVEPLKTNKAHSAGHFYKREQQLHQLLTLNEYVCKTIKKMTLMISAEWIHSEYC